MDCTLLSDNLAMKWFGVDRRTIYRWKQDGSIKIDRRKKNKNIKIPVLYDNIKYTANICKKYLPGRKYDQINSLRKEYDEQIKRIYLIAYTLLKQLPEEAGRPSLNSLLVMRLIDETCYEVLHQKGVKSLPEYLELLELIIGILKTNYAGFVLYIIGYVSGGKQNSLFNELQKYFADEHVFNKELVKALSQKCLSINKKTKSGMTAELTKYKGLLDILAILNKVKYKSDFPPASGLEMKDFEDYSKYEKSLAEYKKNKRIVRITIDCLVSYKITYAGFLKLMLETVTELYDAPQDILKFRRDSSIMVNKLITAGFSSKKSVQFAQSMMKIAFSILGTLLASAPTVKIESMVSGKSVNALRSEHTRNGKLVDSAIRKRLWPYEKATKKLSPQEALALKKIWDMPPRQIWP